jgi:CRP/FNR family transcriptional regulator
VRLFQGLGDQDIQRLRGICAEKRLPAGAVVFAESDLGKAMFVVIEGEVRIVADADGGQVLATVGAGEVFGELALVDGLPRSAGARCAQDSTLLVIQASDFHQLADRHPAIGKAVLLNLCRTLSARLRAADDVLETYRLPEPPSVAGSGAP